MIGLVCSLLWATPVAVFPVQAELISSAQTSLTTLLAGNQRFSHDHATHPHQSHDQWAVLKKGQHPFAAVLTCSDSRIAPEVIFDQGLGDIFDVRVAGNIADAGALGSLEYAVEHLHVPFILVLGHQNCGAVEARLTHQHPHNHIHHILHALSPAVRHAHGSLEEAVKENVHRVVTRLEKTKALKEKIESGELQVIGAYYNLDSGEVELLSSSVVH